MMGESGNVHITKSQTSDGIHEYQTVSFPDTKTVYMVPILCVSVHVESVDTVPWISVFVDDPVCFFCGVFRSLIYCL